MIHPGEPRTLYYVQCPSFHGATFFALLLNNHSHVSHLGDALPRRDRFDQVRCSCGAYLEACAFWRHLWKASGADRFAESIKMIPDYPELAAHFGANRLLNLVIATGARVVGRRAWIPFRTAADTYLDAYLRLRAAVLSWQRTALFVDGGKSLTRMWVNGSLLPEASVKLIHIIRDPRAFHSSNVKVRGGDYPASISCREWKSQHRRILVLGRTLASASYLKIRYEDLCREPEPTLNRVLDFLEIPREPLLFAPRQGRKNHVIGHRSKSGFDGTIRFRESWKETLAPREAQEILRRTQPYASRFGYRDG